MRIFLQDEPWVNVTLPWIERGLWPAKWIDLPNRPTTSPSVALFRLRFHLAQPAKPRIHVSADNRYRVFLDGHPVGRGPERGAPHQWHYESYELELKAGAHVLVALNWWLADSSPYAQMQIRPGFLLAAEGQFVETLSTGIAPWEGKLIHGISMLSAGPAAFGAGDRMRIDGASFPWGWETGDGLDWLQTEVIAPAMLAAWKNEIAPYWLLSPATLPPMNEQRRCAGKIRHLVPAATEYPVKAAQSLTNEAAQWQMLLDAQSVLMLPPHTSRRAIIDLENYYCAYPELRVSQGKGARIALKWAEGLFEQPSEGPKGNRNVVEGKYFVGIGDEFLPDGGSQRVYSTLWWEAGRYIEMTIETADEPLTIHSFSLLETGYPFQIEHEFHSSQQCLEQVIPTATRALQMCSHETYMDCPYYEQLMYIGDTRLEALTTFTITHDDRLPRKALRCFDLSRRLSGFTQSRYPSRVAQIIPTFSLWYVCMIHDYWSYRDDMPFIRSLLPGARAVLEAFHACLREDGLLSAPNGWNYVDWVPGWTWGFAPDAEFGVSSIVNLQFVLALLSQAELEEYFGQTLLAERNRQTAQRVFQSVLQQFWDEQRGMLADNLAHSCFSEHAQCLAILSGLLPDAKLKKAADGLLSAPDLARTTIYFTHYLFETYYRLGAREKILERMALWFELDSLGLKTTLEAPEPTRSDCHAWGAHPIYHFHASLLGVRPQGPGFRQVRIAPLLSSLESAQGALPHPRGMIRTSFGTKDAQLHARITLPEQVSGNFVWQGHTMPLHEGTNDFSILWPPQVKETPTK